MVFPVVSAEQPQPIGPAEAAKKVNQQVTVQMDVKASTGRDRYCFLNSEENFRDSKTFTVFINAAALAKFKEAKIDDPAAHFQGQNGASDGQSRPLQQPTRKSS